MYKTKNFFAESGPRDNSTVNIPPPDTFEPVAEDDFEEEVNEDSVEDYFEEVAALENESGLGIWWIIFIITSWAITFAALYLVIKERPDLVPMCILNPMMRCTGQRRGGDQLITDDP
jgi:hypothetical protein